MKRPPIPYSATEIAWLSENRSLPIQEYHAAFQAAFPRPDVRAQDLHALRKRRGWKTGRSGRFEPGTAPSNKGKRCAPGTGGLHPNARATQFKKGGLPHNHVGGGHERIDAQDGYVVMIVDEINPWTGAATRPVHKHRYLWEQANGPVPEGYALKCLDGNKTNCDPANWELVPRGMLPMLNGRWAMRYDDAPAELKPVLMTIAKLKLAKKKLKERKAGAA